MVCALEMFFEKSEENMIMEYWLRFKNEKISTYLLDVDSRPHLTVGCFNNIDIGHCSERLQDFCNTNKKLQLIFPSIGVFTKPKPCVFLAPVVTNGLLDMHSKLFEVFSDCDYSGFEFYTKDKWMPHCAMDIATDIETVCKSTDLLLRNFVPFSTYVSEIGWVLVDKPVKTLHTFPLS